MQINSRSQAFFAHLIISAVVAGTAAVLVFFFWFPGPYRSLAGGLYLFWILIAVDVSAGPLLTAVIFNKKKPHRELTLDLICVGVLQAVALIYGLYSISLARPIALVFESDRMVAISAAQIENDLPEKAEKNYLNFSWKGPVLVGTREPSDNDEMMKSLDLSLQGIPPSMRPDWWQPIERNIDTIKKKMHPLGSLYMRSSDEDKVKIQLNAKKIGKNIDEIFFLPLVSQHSLDEWSALFDSNAALVGYMDIDGFQ